MPASTTQRAIVSRQFLRTTQQMVKKDDGGEQKDSLFPRKLALIKRIVFNESNLFKCSLILVSAFKPAN
jgi:hypothetical protein